MRPLASILILVLAVQPLMTHVVTRTCLGPESGIPRDCACACGACSAASGHGCCCADDADDGPPPHPAPPPENENEILKASLGVAAAPGPAFVPEDAAPRLPRHLLDIVAPSAGPRHARRLALHCVFTT
jgi:hypothetical protein